MASTDRELRRIADGVEVWIVDEHAPAVRDRLNEYHQTLLTGEERARAQRFVQPGDRNRFVIGRALARTMLSQFVDVPPHDWTIIIDPHGRPELGPRRPGVPDLRFNLSHTEGLVVCALTIGRDLGVDVEWIGRQVTHDVPERFFSPGEVEALRRLPRDRQDVVFFDYWTLKEAYIKARGLGLALPLGQFTFVLSDSHPPRIELAPDLADDPATWQFAQYWPTASHRMAVAVRRRGNDLPVVLLHVVPGVRG